MTDNHRGTEADGGTTSTDTRADAPELVRPADLEAVEDTPGIVRRVAFERPALVVAESTIAPGTTTGWHHHGERDVYGFLVRGEAVLEYGEQGRTTGRAPAFFHVPAGTVHRETNTGDGELVVAAHFLGEGPVVGNVEGPGDG